MLFIYNSLIKKTPLTDKELSQQNFIEKEFIMYNDNIDNNRRKIQEILGSNLAGPLDKYILRSWIHDILEELGVQFREAVFSPLGHVMGIYWPGSGPGSIM
jgi:hypothetical protein